MRWGDKRNYDLIDIDQGTYEILKDALSRKIYEQVGKFETNPEGELYFENDRDCIYNTHCINTIFTLDQLRILETREKPLIELNLVLGNNHYNYGLYNDDIILIPGDVVIFYIYGISFRESFGTYTGEYLTERAIAAFLVKCWNKVLTREDLNDLQVEIEEEKDNIVKSRMIDLFPRSSVNCLLRQENHGLMADAVYVVELVD